LIKGLDSTLRLLPPVEGKDGSDGDGPYQEITVPSNFPPSSILLFSTQLEGLDPQMDEICKNGADEAFAGLNLTDLNAILYRCENEERDATGENDIPSLYQKVTFLKMGLSEPTTSLDSENWFTVGCRGGWLR
jgi:glycogen debranching enzyme